MWPWSTIRRLKDDLEYVSARFQEEGLRADENEATNGKLTKALGELRAEVNGKDAGFEAVSKAWETERGILREDAATIERENGLLKSQVGEQRDIIRSHVASLNRLVDERDLAQTQGAESQRRYEEAKSLADRLTEQLALASKNDARDAKGRFTRSSLIAERERDSLLDAPTTGDLDRH